AGDPRTNFGPNGTLPIATKFYDFIICTLPLKPNPFDNVIALSFKGAGLKVARQLNTLIMMRGADCYAGRYELTTTPEKNTKGDFFNFKVNNVEVPRNWLTKEESTLATAMFNQLAKMTIVIDREPGSDDDVEFPPIPATAEM
ncbi:MAG: hypothetical protein ACHQX3_09195, partial [Nitrospirales bacterium]